MPKGILIVFGTCVDTKFIAKIDITSQESANEPLDIDDLEEAMHPIINYILSQKKSKIKRNKMKSAILIHGMPSKEEYLQSGSRMTHKHWFPWIQRELEKNGVKVYIPEMPEPYAPEYEKWKAAFEKLPIDEETMLVGHSSGGGFLVRWLSENKVKVGKVALIAAWTNPNGAYPTKMFDDFKIDENLADRTAGIAEFISLDDDEEQLKTLEILKSKIKGLEIKQFTDKGHFTLGDMKTEEFPELLEFLIQN